jgi:two-component system, response regulator PdtaR
MTRPLRIAVAEDERNMREYLRELLPRLGHEAVAVESGRQLVELCRTAPPDLILTDVRMDDMDGLAAAAEINRDAAVPVILISAHHDDELRARARQEYVMAYLVKPVKQADLEMAIDLAMMRFEHFQAVRQEAAGLRQALEDRKLIERAKGAVMRRVGLDEQESFRRLRKLSADQNRKLVEVARTVVSAEEVYRGLERPDPVASPRAPAARPERPGDKPAPAPAPKTGEA